MMTPTKKDIKSATRELEKEVGIEKEVKIVVSNFPTGWMSKDCCRGVDYDRLWGDGIKSVRYDENGKKRISFTARN